MGTDIYVTDSVVRKATQVAKETKVRQKLLWKSKYSVKWKIQTIVLTLFWSPFILILDFQIKSRLLNHDIHSLVSSLQSSICHLNLCDYFYLLTGVNVPQELVFNMLELRQNSVQTLKVATRLLQPDTRNIKQDSHTDLHIFKLVPCAFPPSAPFWNA